MSVRAGSIVTVGGRNVVDRLQSATLDGNVPIETVYEIGNDLVVGKVPGEADFTWSLESWDVSTDLMALLHGKVGNQAANQPPGSADAAGTEYKWEDVQALNMTSPWKKNVGSVGGDIGGGLLIPNLFPTQLSYSFGVTDMASQTVQLSGGEFYYAKAAPVEETASGDGTQTAFVTSEDARAYRIGGGGGSTFQYVFGVMVNGVPQIPGVDYTETNAAGTAGDPGVGTITFASAPASGAQVRYVYFTEVAKAYPQAVNADTTIKPAAVRGRNIVVLLNGVKLHGIQSFTLQATLNTDVDRELGYAQPVGRSVNSTDTTGAVTVRPRDLDALFAAMSSATGVATDEVIGYFNENLVPLEVQIQNPKNPGEILKTIYVAQAQIQPPPLSARVNTATDFAMQWAAGNGTFSEFKGAKP